jgi:hypothetical protein
MTRVSGQAKLVLSLALGTILFLIGAGIAQATTYYVSPTGSDSNAGTAASSPFGTIQKCVGVMAAGDTCTVADGTYTDSDGNGVVAYIRPEHQNGTSSNPITLKSTNRLGAKIIISSINGTGNHGIHVNRSYWIIDGFDFSGGNGVTGSGNTSISGVTMWYSTGTVIRNNRFHNIADAACTFANYGFTGVFVAPGSGNVLIDNNLFHTIGRLNSLDGTGCSYSVSSAGDHGIYAEAPFTGLTIKRNVFYNIVKGWPIHIYNSTGSTASNISIHNNSFSDKSKGGSSGPAGHVLLARSMNNVSIMNNISHDAYVGMVRCSSVTGTNIVVNHNLSGNGIKTGDVCPEGVTFSENLTSTVPGFISTSTRDYRLAAGSAAIDRGFPISGITYAGSAPDIGAYEYGTGTGTTVLAPKNLRVQ